MTATRNNSRFARLVRPGFTLVELFTAMTLSIGMVLVLTESFKLGLDFTRHAHGTGELMHQLNGAGVILVSDLERDHFLPNPTKPNAGVKLSDIRYDRLTNGGSQALPPKDGYFRIVSPQPSGFQIQTDAEQFTSNTATNHAIQFTSIITAPGQNKYYTVDVGGVAYRSKAAEFAYFLVPMPGNPSTGGGATGQPLYNLHRRMRLVAITSDEMSTLQPAVAVAGHNEVIASNAGVVNTLADLTDPARRVPLASLPISSSRYGEDILLSNVLSFEVLPEWDRNLTVAGSNQPARAFAGGGGTINNSDHPHDYLAIQNGANSTFTGQGVFDTWRQIPGWNNFAAANPSAVPLAVRIKTLSITIRLFDPKTKLSRQSTWKLSM